MRNWAGNHVYRAARLVEPRSVDELQAVVAGADRLRVLGTRHTFNDLVDTPGDLVSLRRLPRRFELDAGRGRLTIDGGTTYGDLAARLDAEAWALANLASLPHISVAGACATATHGSGDRQLSLAAAVTSLEIVRGDGELERIDEDDPRLPGAVVALGALGAVTALTLSIQPAYRVRQDVYEDLPFATAIDRLDRILAAADAVSLFTDWSEAAFHQVWLKRRVDPADAVARASTLELRPAVLGEARPATVEHHPIRGLSAESTTPQLGSVGPWHERLPHFRLDHQPSAGEELQSEYLVPRASAAAGLAALASLRPLLAPLTLATEVRSVAADDRWLSPMVERDTVGFHFTWRPDWPAVRDALPAVEGALEPFDVRQHWGKLFTIPAQRVRAAYPRRRQFVELARALDPRGAFANDFVERFVLRD